MSVPAGVSGLAAPVLTIGVVGFCLPASDRIPYLGGAFALDFGGKQASAASSGIIDGIGIRGILAGDSVARLAAAFGWTAYSLPWQR